MRTFQQALARAPAAKARGVGEAATRDGLRRARIAARRATDAKVDATGVEGFQHSERLGGTERAVVREQNAARSDAHAFRFRAQASKQDLGARIGEGGDRVVLGEPVAVIAELVCAARQRERFLDGAARSARRSRAIGPGLKNVAITRQLKEPWFQSGDVKCEIRRRATPTKSWAVQRPCAVRHCFL